MTAPTLSLFVLAIGSTLGVCANESACPQRESVSGDRFVIQAHRGGGSDLPENTIETFQAAWQWGVVPEADIRVSKDGVICAFHDNDFARLAKNVPPPWKKKKIADLTWNELQQLDVGAYAGEQYAGQRIPKLDDTFRMMAGHPERWLYLDVKEVPLDKMAALVKKHGVEKQVIFTSTHHDLIRRWKKIVPESQSLLWMGGSEKALSKRIEQIAKDDFEGITSLQIHVRLQKPGSQYPFSPSPDFLRKVGRRLRARQITYQSLPWGTSDPKVYHALMDLGVESFASDHPRVTQQAVKDYFASKRGDSASGPSPTP